MKARDSRMKRTTESNLRRVAGLVVAVIVLTMCGVASAQESPTPAEVQGDNSAAQSGGVGAPNPAGIVTAGGVSYLRGAPGQSDFLNVVGDPRAYFAFQYPGTAEGQSFALVINEAMADYLDPLRAQENVYERGGQRYLFFDYNSPGTGDNGLGVPLRATEIDRWVPWRVDTVDFATGDRETGRTVRLLIDTRAPTSAGTLTEEPRAINVSSVGVAFSASDPVAVGGTDASGIARVAVLVKHETADWEQSGAGPDGASTETITYAFARGDGEYYFATMAWDRAGNHEELPSGTGDDSIIYDTTKPNSQAACDDFNNTGSVPVSWTASDDLPAGVTHSGVKATSLWVRYEEGSWADSGLAPQEGGSGTFVFLPATEGRYFFATRTSDDAGNVEIAPTGAGDDSTIYDRTAPQSTCSSPKYNNTGTVAINWMGDDNLPPHVTHSGIGSVALWVKFEGGTAADSGLPVQTGTSGTFNYSFAYGEGTYYFKARATDRAGNTESLVRHCSTIYDITPPTFQPINVNPARAKAGDAVTITFTVSEPLREDPVVKVGNNFATKSGQLGNAYSYSYDVVGGPTDVEGENVIQVSGFDRAGNRGQDETSVYFNFTPPTFLNITPSPDPARAGVTVTITFTATEALWENPVVTVNGNPATFVSRTGLDYTYSYLVQGTEPEGENTIVIRGMDLAGNVHEDDSARVTFDFTLPTFSDIETTADPARAGVTVTITFTASEELSGNPTVTVGANPATFVSRTGLDYTYSYAVQGTEPEGRSTITITGTDIAGNVGVDSSGGVTFDFTPPTFTVTNVSPDPAKAGVTVTITFTASEELSENPEVTVGANPATFVSQTGLNYTYSYVVQGTEPEGRNTITITGTDIAGNVGADSSAGVTFDFTPPTFINIQVSPNPAGAGETLTIAFDASEPLSENPTVTVGTNPATFVSKTGNSYTYSYIVQGTEPEGENVIVITGTDLAGNVGTDNSKTVTITYIPAPTLVWVRELDAVTNIPDGGTTTARDVIVKGFHEPDTEVHVFDIYGLWNPYDPSAPTYGYDPEMGTPWYVVRTTPRLPLGTHVFVARAKRGAIWSKNSNTWTITVVTTMPLGQEAPVPLGSGVAVASGALILATAARVLVKRSRNCRRC